ncbi:T3SS effector HopA1 family protein [Cyanobium sp. PCC 7001]|uniref:T3SS effector HopA1 family protein n=1 Tax=Cyanobium sp. PCC 7001 TaxID=180281 RepID=UPI00350E4009
MHKHTFGRTDSPGSLDGAAPDQGGLDGDQREGGADGLISGPSDPPDLAGDLEDLSPDVFLRVRKDGLKFYVLFQRAPELSDALADLEESYRACCLIHNDLKFANILLLRCWSQCSLPTLPARPDQLSFPGEGGILRLIDWEQGIWGDPALDLGALVAEYLRLWLKSLPLSSDLAPAAALALAEVPLDTLQPSMRGLLEAYLAQFPAILQEFPDFPERVIRFAGLSLLEAIQDRLHYREPFGNLDISMLQVARTLLCSPGAALQTVFGRSPGDPHGSDDHSRTRRNPRPPSRPSARPSVRRSHPGVLAETCQQLGSPPEPVPVPLPLQVGQQGGSTDQRLADLLEQVQLEPGVVRHSTKGSRRTVHPATLHRATLHPASAQMNAAYRLRQITQFLHSLYFSGALESPAGAPTLGDGFTRQLQAANSGLGFVDHGWTVTAAEEQQVQVQKQGLHLWVDVASELVIPSPSVRKPGAGSAEVSLAPGTCVGVRLPNAAWVGDDYVAIGNAGEPGEGQPALEVFFNISPEGAVLLMRALIPGLNRWHHPFALKILAEPNGYPRFNAAVLHLPVSAYPHLHALLTHCHPTLRPHLRDPIPLFTQPLARGIGLAESPAGADDFGLDRFQLVAAVLQDAPPEPGARQRALRQAFARRRLDWCRPHLEPGSAGQYQPLEPEAISRPEATPLPGVRAPADAADPSDWAG